jgi:predicted DsbA family dithiol-disulfide isomerase
VVRLIYYLDVLSSWCYLSEPHVQALRAQYGRRLEYEWRIALITAGDPHGYSREQIEWFYKRSAAVTGTQLNAAWCQGPHTSLAPNLAAEAARSLGFEDDRVRLALARAALVQGIPVYLKGEAAAVAAAACDRDVAEILERMDDPAVERRIRETSEEFAALQLDQRPGFVFVSSIGDRAAFSGIWRREPLAAVIDAMLKDADAYAAFAAANPPLPAH